MEMNTLIQLYLKEVKKQNLSLIEIDQRPHHKKVWTWYLAKAYYKLDGYYERQEDIHEGLETYTIITDTVMTQHFLFNGYPTVQTMDKAACKKYYD